VPVAPEDADALVVALHARYARQLLHWLTDQAGGDRATAEDVAQDAWETVLRAARSGAVRLPAGRLPASWLWRVAASRLVDCWRRGASRERAAGRLAAVAWSGGGADPDRLAQPEAAALDGEARAAWAALVAALERRSAHYALAARWQMAGRTQAEMAAAWGVPLGTVKTHCLRAKRHLRRAYDAERQTEREALS
jgi:RNA polymerase sigma-70 factor (ECF subfamily)